MSAATMSAEWVLAVVRSRRAERGVHGYGRMSPVDGPFAETKEWMGCELPPVPAPGESVR